MNLDKMLTDILQYIQGNLVGSIAAGVILLYLLIKKPRLFFILLCLCIAGIGVMYVFDKLSATGISDKNFRSLTEIK